MTGLLLCEFPGMTHTSTHTPRTWGTLTR